MRRKTIDVSFTCPQTSRFLYNILPAAIFSTLVGHLFLLGESVSCLEDAEIKSSCADVVNSNYHMSLWLTTMAAVRVAVLPFMTSKYTMTNVVRFDFTFAEQAQIIFVGFALALAIFIFASSNIGDYDETGLLTSKQGRSTLIWSAWYFIFNFFPGII